MLKPGVLVTMNIHDITYLFPVQDHQTSTAGVVGWLNAASPFGVVIAQCYDTMVGGFIVLDGAGNVGRCSVEFLKAVDAV